MPPKKPDFESLIRRLNECNVDYVVIGGLALVLHGVDYSTFDADIAIAVNDENKSKIVDALAPYSPRPILFAANLDFPWDERSVFGLVSSLVTDIGEIDFFLFVPGIDSYEGLASRSKAVSLYGSEFRVASIGDMILMKKEANRPKDIAIIPELERIVSESNDDS